MRQKTTGENNISVLSGWMCCLKECTLNVNTIIISTLMTVDQKVLMIKPDLSQSIFEENGFPVARGVIRGRKRSERIKEGKQKDRVLPFLLARTADLGNFLKPKVTQLSLITVDRNVEGVCFTSGLP